jgi:hypothetical protein
MPQICDMGKTALLPFRRHAEEFFARKNPTASAGSEPAILVPEASMQTTRPPKPLSPAQLQLIMNSVFCATRFCETKSFPTHSLLNTVGWNLIRSAIRLNKTSGPRFTADWLLPPEETVWVKKWCAFQIKDVKWQRRLKNALRNFKRKTQREETLWRHWRRWKR